MYEDLVDKIVFWIYEGEVPMDEPFETIRAIMIKIEEES